MNDTTAREHEIDWRRALEAVVWLPETHRNATVPMATARRALRCTERSFAQLIELGLPFVEGPEGPLFDAVDLKNVGLYSGSQATEVEMAMRLMLGFMRAPREDLIKAKRWRFRLALQTDVEAGARLLRRVYRPMPEMFGGTVDKVQSADGQACEVAGPFFRVVQGADAAGTMTVLGRELTLRSSEIRAIFDEFVDSGLRWHALPETFAAAPEEALALGVGNCGTLCAALCERLVGAGFEARTYHGWMLTPAEVDHGWVEVVDDDGEVKFLDPSFALLATGNGFGTIEFRDLTAGSFVNRVTPTRAPLDEPYIVDGGTGDVVVFTSRADTADPGRSRRGLARLRLAR